MPEHDGPGRVGADLDAVVVAKDQPHAVQQPVAPGEVDADGGVSIGHGGHPRRADCLIDGGDPELSTKCGADQALPRILFILVPQTGQVPFAMRRPLVSATSPSKSRFSLHFTQYPLYVSAIARSFRQGVTSRKDDAPVARRAPGSARSDNSAHRTGQRGIHRGFGSW